MTEPEFSLPLHGRHLRLGRWALPAWGGGVLGVAVVLLQFGLLDAMRLLPEWLTDDALYLVSGGTFDHLRQGFLWFLTLQLCPILTVLVWARSRRDFAARLEIHTDRLELENEGVSRTLHWQNIVPYPAGQADVWFDTDTLGTSTRRHMFISFFYAEHGAQHRENLSLLLYPKPFTGPRWKDMNTLRHAFLLSLVRARPDLRIEPSVCDECELDHARLLRSRWPKWRFYLLMAGALLLLDLLFMAGMIFLAG